MKAKKQLALCFTLLLNVLLFQNCGKGFQQSHHTVSVEGSLTNSSTATASLEIQWDPTVDQRVLGYKLKIGTKSGIYIQELDVGNNLSASFTDLVPGVTYYFASVAYSATEESPLSNEISFLAQ